MIKYQNNPIKGIVDVCQRLYPSIECQLIFAEGIKEKDDAWAATVWPDDGSAPQMWIDASAPYNACIELIAHEFAHVVTGEGNGHDVKWENTFDLINAEFNNRQFQELNEDTVGLDDIINN